MLLVSLTQRSNAGGSAHVSTTGLPEVALDEAYHHPDGGPLPGAPDAAWRFPTRGLGPPPYTYRRPPPRKRAEALAWAFCGTARQGEGTPNTGAPPCGRGAPVSVPSARLSGTAASVAQFLLSASANEGRMRRSAVAGCAPVTGRASGHPSRGPPHLGEQPSPDRAALRPRGRATRAVAFRALRRSGRCWAAPISASSAAWTLSMPWPRPRKQRGDPSGPDVWGTSGARQLFAGASRDSPRTHMHSEVRPARFERATSASAGQRSIP
jgi:hypothetical protein